MNKLTHGLLTGAAVGLLAGGAAAMMMHCARKPRGGKMLKQAATKALHGAETLWDDMLCCVCR